MDADTSMDEQLTDDITIDFPTYWRLCKYALRYLIRRGIIDACPSTWQ